MLEYLSQVANSQPLPSNVVAGPGGGQTQTGAPGLSGAGGAAPSNGSQDPIKDATAVLNALSGLKKAGVPVTDEEVNIALAKAGLPPLQSGTPIPEPITSEPVDIQRPVQAQSQP